MSENSVDTPESSPAKPPKAKPIDIKKPKPSDIEQFIDKPTEQGGIDQFDVKGFTSLISTTSGGYDESDDQRLSKSLDDALDLHSQRLGITKDELESGLVELKINPGKVASDIVSKKQDPSKVYESLTKRTLAGEDAQKQRVKKRGELIAELGGLRADRKIGRTVRETGIVHESLKDRPSPTLQIQEGKAGFFGTDIEDEESAPKPGDVAYDELKILNSAMEAAAETDASMNRVIEMRNRYGTDELGAAKYINERALDILNSKNISVDGQFGTVDENLNAIQSASDDYRYQVNKAKDRAVNEIAMWKTIGVWTAPTFIRWHGVQDSSELKAKDVFKPTVEIVGLNKFGRPIGRVQGGLQWGMEINDALQSAATGIISEKQGTLRERALKGVAERQNFLEAALASDMYKRGGTAGKIAAGTSGFLASVLFPDLTFGVAGAYSAGRKSVTEALTMGKAKKAISLKEDAAKALVAGLDGSRSELRKAAGLSSEARKIAPKAMDEVDTNDFNVSRRLGRQNPDILNGKEGKELASKLPGELGELKVNMHPSIRRRIARTGDPSDDIRQAPGIAYDEAYDYGRHLDLVDEARTMVNAQDNAIYTRFIKKKLTGISTLLQKGLKEIPGINRSRVFSLAQDVTKLARDPDAWKRATLDTLNEEMVRVGSKDPDDFMKAVESVLDEMIETSKKVIDESDDFDEMAMLINRAEEAIKTNIESRAVAHALQREIMAGQLGLKVAPIIAKSTGKVDELMGRKMTGGNLEYMSEQAINFMDQIVEKTEISKEHALEAAVILDLRAKMEARKTGFNEAKYWKERIAGIGDRAEFMRKLYAPPAPFDAEAVARASLPDGFTIELQDKKWVIENAEGVSYSSTKTDAIDAAAEAIDKLVDEGVIKKSDLDMSPTRVGPLLLGQPISLAEDVIRRLPIEYAMAHTEDGIHVIRKTSNAPNYVAFSSPEVKRLMDAENLVFTHNHPGGSAFSDADIIFSMSVDAREIRATQNNGGVWSMVFPDGFGDFSKAALQKKYGSFSAIPVEKSIARRAFEEEIRNAANEAAREASQKVRSQSAKEAIDRTGATEAWGAFYSEALVGTADEAGVLSGGRLGAVFERRGVKGILTRVEPKDTTVRIRPGSESTFGETARRAATQQGIDLLLQRLPRQSGFEFREVGDDLVEVTSREIRDAVGDAEGIDAGLTFKVEDNVLRVESAAIPEALRGRGLGTELYLKALSRAADAGLGFASDISPSPDALALYERLIDAGVPLRRKMVEGPDGNMVRQYEATADELRGVNLKAELAGPPTAAKTDTPEFKRWFGDSKVVDESGKPLVVYHGSRRSRGFEKFDPAKRGTAFDTGFLGEGFYFSTKPDTAAYYAGVGRAPRDMDELVEASGFVPVGREGSILPAYLSLKNPYDFGTKTQAIRGLVMRGERLPDDIHDAVVARAGFEFDPDLAKADYSLSVTYPLEQSLSRAMTEVLTERGYDGVIARVGDELELVAFEPTQAKSKFNPGTFDPTDPRILKQEIDDTVKGAVEFMDDGRAIIYAFEEADFSTLVHEIGHIIRRDLDPADMDEVLGWVKSLGADVTVTAGRFKGAPDEVRKAEEFFAEAFENYIMTGKPPVKGLEDMFSRMKQFMLDIYKTISPVAKPSPEIKKTFDKLLTVEPPTQPVLKRVMKLIGTEIFGPTDERKLNVIRELSREAQRLGVPNADYDTLIDQFENTGKITLDKGIFFSRYGAGGKSEFGPNDLADLRKSMEVEIASEAAQFRPGVNTTASSQGLTELKPTERIEQILRGDSATSKIGAVAKSTFMGGDVTAERGLGNLVPEVRASVETATREVQQAAGEVIRLTAEAAEGPGSTGYSKLLDYLTGERVQFEKSGRNVFTSGHDSVAAIFDSVRLFMTDRMAGDGRLDVLIELANRAAKGERLELTGLGKQTAFIGSKELRLKDAMEEAWDTTFRNKSSPMFFNDLLMAVAPKVHAGGNLEPKHFQDFTEIVMYYSGQSVRNGDKFKGTSRQLAEGFLADLRKTFDAESASRVGILLGVHGQADRARQLWAGLGIAVDKTARDYYIRFLNGEDIPPQYIGRVKDLVKRFGVQTNFVETSLLDTTFYVPAQARARLNQAITRGIDPEVRSIAASESDIKGIKGVILRYMKTRMTRGGVAVRQRYFLMNTIDHFVQMAIINGFRPALSSTTRLVFQDLMILPGVARTIDLMERAARAGGVPRNIAEGLRRKLQTGGDTIGRALAASKYNLNVNPVLEGADGFVRLGGNVYSYKEIREIAVQEGIFASFDTSQLSNSVKRSGRELLTKNKEEATKVGMLGAKTDRLLDQTGEFLTQVVADTSEAWAERERLGAMVSLMEFGVSPRVAARLTIDALYDYAGSMTKMDRAWFVSLALPFWAFQKNANRQIINSMLSPGGAYRMGVIRRAQERGADLLTDLLYYSVTDEYGVDTEAMESANEELYEEYITLRNRLEEYYNGPDKVPESMKTAFRMWMSGRSQMVDNGKIVDLEATFADKVAMGGSGAPVTKFREFTRAPVSKSARRSYLRDRTAVAVPVSLQKEAVRRYYAGIESKTKDHPYIEVFVPDSTINAGFRHIANLTAFYVLALDKSTNFIQDRAFGEDSDQTGIAEVSPLTALRQVVDLERSLIAGDVIREVTGKPGYPRRVHPWIADLTEQTFAVKLYRTLPKDDTVGLPDEREGVEFQEERIYMFPGAWQIAFDNSPLGELNNMMMQQYDFKVPEGSYFPEVRLKVTALERESARGRMIAWARALTGVQTAETSGREAARREEPTRLTVTKRPR